MEELPNLNDIVEQVKLGRLIDAAPDLLEAAAEALAVLNKFGDWEDGIFYLNGVAFPEIQEPIKMLTRAILKT